MLSLRRTPGLRRLLAGLVLCAGLPGLFGGMALASPALAPSSVDAGDLPAAFQPAWADAPSLRQLSLTYDSALSAEGNGAQLKSAMQALIPGDTLTVGAGTWSVNSFFDVSVSGTPAAPIRVIAAAGARPVITRPNAGQNVINLGSPAFGGIRYFLLRGFELTGGGMGMRIYAAEHLWVDDCHIHHMAGVGLSVNTNDASHLHLTRNEISHTGQSGEGMYLGGNYGSVVLSHSVIARNEVHHTGGSQGDGIELKQGSFGNWIVENRVWATKYPCLLVYGTGGEARNRIERNVLWDSESSVLQVQGEALVANNVVFGGPQGFTSHDHQGLTRDLELRSNTILCEGDAARLGDWHDRPGMILAGNALYSAQGEAVRFVGGSSGIEIQGNITFGPVIGSSTGWSPGNGLGDFEAASWDGSLQNVVPSAGSPLRTLGDPQIAAQEDLAGMVRGPYPSAGAAEPGSYGRVLGPGLAGTAGLVPRLTASALPESGHFAFQVRLEQARPLTPAFLLVGLSSSPTPFRGGTWYPLATALVRTDTTAQGRAIAELPLAPGAGFGAGQTVVAQWAVFDPGAPEFYALSPGVLWTLE